MKDEIIELRWKMNFGNDEEREDAAARLEYLEWQNALNKKREWGHEEEKPD